MHGITVKKITTHTSVQLETIPPMLTYTINGHTE